MIYIFYSLGILAVVWEIKCALQPEYTAKLVSECIDLIKNGQIHVTHLDGSSRYPTHRNLTLLANGYTLWMFIGVIFTSQTLPFAILISCSIFMDLLQIGTNSMMIRRIDSVLIVIILSFILTNGCTLHMSDSDIFKLFRLY